MLSPESETKPLYLNGVYYDGPRRTFSSSPPPASQGTGNRQNGSSICVTLVRIVFIIFMLLGLTCFVFYMIVEPTPAEFYVEGASLTQFDLTNWNTLRYDLKLNISIWNQNKRIGIYYDEIDMAAYYRNQRFGWVTRPALYQPPKTANYFIDVVNFSGQSVMEIGDGFQTEFEKEKRNGLFNIDIRIRPKLRSRLGKLKTSSASRRLWCHFQVPLAWSKTANQYEGLRKLAVCRGPPF